MIILDNFCSFCIFKSICCDPSSGSDEGSQHMASMRNKKNYNPQLLSNTPSYIEL